MTVLLERGFRFDGVNDGLDLGVVGDVDVATVEAWVSTEAQADTGYRFLFGFVSRYGVFLQANQLTAFDWGAAAGRNAGAWPQQSFAPWHHIALVYRDAVAGGSQFYVDGVAFGAPITLSVGAATKGLLVGASLASGASQNSRGNVRDLRLWGRALTAPELGAFRPSLRGDEAGLLAWYPLEVDALDRRRWPSLGGVFIDEFTGAPPFLGRLFPGLGSPWTATDGDPGATLSGDSVLFASSAKPAIFDAGTPDVELEAEIVCGGGARPSIVLRGKSEGSRLLVHPTGGGLTFFRNTGGGDVSVFGPIGGVNYLDGLPHRIKVRAQGTAITVTDEVGATWTGTDAYNAKVTTHGLRNSGGGAGAEWRWLKVTRLPSVAGVDGLTRGGARPANARVA